MGYKSYISWQFGNWGPSFSPQTVTLFSNVQRSSKCARVVGMKTMSSGRSQASYLGQSFKYIKIQVFKFVFLLSCSSYTNRIKITYLEQKAGEFSRFRDGLRLDGQCSILGRDKRFFFSTSSKLVLAFIQPPTQRLVGAYPRVKAAGAWS
jgi:hypothetical protein